MTLPFRLTFPRGPGRTYPDAVRFALRAAAYEERREGRRRIHEATFGRTPEQLGALRDCWALVRTWKAARLEVHGVSLLPQGGDGSRSSWPGPRHPVTRRTTRTPPQ